MTVPRPLVAAAHRALERCHAFVYFAPQPAARYAALGVTHPGQQYFGSRAAAFGACSPELVLATFYNFAPRAVHRAVPAVWSIAAPADLLAARLAGADEVLAPLVGPVITATALAEAADLAEVAVAALTVPGHPLYAAHAALPPPVDGAHLRLFHAATLLREWRGDGHVALLVAHDVGPCECLQLHAACGGPDPRVLQTSRGWSDDDWARTAARLTTLGLLAGGAVTPSGSRLRDDIEAATDELDQLAWSALGTERTRRFIDLVAPLAEHLAPLSAVMADRAAPTAT